MEPSFIPVMITSSLSVISYVKASELSAKTKLVLRTSKHIVMPNKTISFFIHKTPFGI